MTAAHRIGLSADAEAVATALERVPGYRVLRELTPLRRRRRGEPIDGLLHGVALDVETEGLDPARHQIVELAMQRFLFDPHGRIVETGRSSRWLQDPGRPLSPEIVRLTGLTDEELAGRSIMEAEATSILLDCDAVFAHNAAFDRPFVERRLPIARGRPWCCTLAEVDWRAHGFEGRTLSHLLSQCGFFYSAHRADVDVAALIRLLDHVLDDTGGTVLATVMEAASRRSWLVEAVGAAFEVKDLLKGRGYRWNPISRLWWREVGEDDFAAERAWACEHVYGNEGEPRCTSVDWTRRHSAR